MILDSKALLLEPQTHVFTDIEDEPGAPCGGVIREFACLRAAPPGAMARERRVGTVESDKTDSDPLIS